MNQGKEIVRPPFLSEGDKVAFVSPAYLYSAFSTRSLTV